jgi:hypothetical protein
MAPRWVGSYSLTQLTSNAAAAEIGRVEHNGAAELSARSMCEMPRIAGLDTDVAEAFADDVIAHEI